MVHGFGRSLLVLTGCALLGAGVAHAQGDAKQLFQEGVQLLRLNKDEEALAKLKEAVASNPSMEDAYQIWKETDYRVWSALMVKGDDFSKISRQLLGMAQLERKRHSADEAAIQPLVEKVLGADYGERRDAGLKLMSEHGDYAVPFLLDALGNADEAEKQTLAILACETIGRPATLPLIAALKSDNALLRRNVAVALTYVGDDRALPALKRLAESDADAGVREVAVGGVKKLAKGASNVPGSLDLYLGQSLGFLAGDPRLLRDGDILEGVWSFQDGKLQQRKVPPSVFGLELARGAAFDALEVDPSSEAAMVVLARAYTAEKAVAEAAMAANPGDPAVAGIKDSVAEMGIAVLAAGPAVMRKAYEGSVGSDMIPAGVESLKALAHLEDPAKLAGSPLLTALKSADKRLRYGAAIALAEMAPRLEGDQRNEVVAALGQAVLEQSVRVVKMLDPNVENQKALREASGPTTGTVVDATANTKEFLIDLRQFPNADVIVLNEKVDDYLAAYVLTWIKDTPALANTKLIMIAADKAKAEETFGSSVHGYIQGPVDGKELMARVDEVLKGVEMPAGRQDAGRYAAAAAEAIASLDPAAYPVANASANLVTVAAREDAVAVPALRALGAAGGASEIAGIVGALGAAKDRPQVAAAAAGALGRIMARTGQADKDAVEALVATASDKALAAEVRQAAVAALGRAPIQPGTRAKLLKDLRVDATIKEAAAEGAGN